MSYFTDEESVASQTVALQMHQLLYIRRRKGRGVGARV
jgi:hypothetical protein